MSLRVEFWRRIPLAQMTAEEWEAVCDGCGRCCLHKLQDEDTGELFFTDVACHLLDAQACQCRDYTHRRRVVPDCIELTLRDLQNFDWLPATCAYRLLAAGQTLPEWHHLECGDREAVHRAGISVRGRCVSEREVDDIEERIVEWLR
ncbi:hypothetical protein BJI67_10820 [Acidihalobacter aeolianus]|uniref:UPF0260 protein BJI67_10820 n=1 Tax=Acidihalobacter aeolianus TaxID=2792603 RepID=A0A1D8K961_9GAMM|nr:YcgN family cysteine cluster protein [Acidihalobacter aeolianus]AOV17487.1 hypothetical protein BJI67_10820 [Acidihalobacter aeolianus]